MEQITHLPDLSDDINRIKFKLPKIERYSLSLTPSTDYIDKIIHRPLHEQILFLKTDILIELFFKLTSLSDLILQQIDQRLTKQSTQLSTKIGNLFYRKQLKDFNFYRLQQLYAAEGYVDWPNHKKLPSIEKIKRLLTPEELEWYYTCLTNNRDPIPKLSFNIK